MSYQSWSIKEVIERIGNNEIYLPAIQRKFVWDHEQIENLFDSIMRGYPIGTFLFWYVGGKKKDEYTFYRFLQKYNEKDHYLNEIAPKPELKDEIIGVLDGQQRLSSMYITLQGTYAYKRPYVRWQSPYAFPKREIYLNLLAEPKERETGVIYEFSFVTAEDVKSPDKDKLWFPVKQVLKWGKDPEIDEYYDNLLNQSIDPDKKKIIIKERKEIKKKIRILHQRLVIEKLINYFKIEEQDLDKILEIFVRVNSGGTILSKSDLLFSTIVANWEQGREEIEAFLKHMNGKGEGFTFDNDLIMRACLVLTDCDVLFKVKSFKQGNIKKIKDNWEKIKNSLDKCVDLLVESGFNSENLTSQNSILPIAYHFMKDGSDSLNSKKELRKYLLRSLLKRTYGGQSDRVLFNLREALRKKVKKDGSDEYELKQKEFSFNLISKTSLPGGRTLIINEKELEEILDYRKGAYTFMVLSLLYPNLKFGQIKFHQDHIHPASYFTDFQLQKHGIPTEKHPLVQSIKDQLPNLQLMEGSENISKNKTPFKKWLCSKDENGNPNVLDVDKFLKDNYIPSTNLDLMNFEKFYDERKKILRIQLKRVLM